MMLADGDFKLSRDLFNKIKDVPNLSIDGVLTVVSFLELDGRNDEAFEILKKIPLAIIEQAQKILLKFAEYLIINKDFNTLSAILTLVEKLRGNFSPLILQNFMNTKVSMLRTLDLMKSP